MADQADIARLAATLDVTVENGVADYAPAGAVFGPAQNPVWVRAWVENRKPDALAVTLREAGRPVMALALEVGRAGPFKAAKIIGESHANGNFPATLPGLDLQSSSVTAMMRAALAKARPDIDMLSLGRMIARYEGVDNPLVGDAATVNPNIRLALDLTPGFDRILTAASGKKAKRQRYNARKYEQAGGYRRIAAASAAEVDRILDAYFAMKAARFRSLGIDDPFADPGTQAFFRTLFTRSLDTRAFTLEALEVGGKLRAISAHSRTAGRVICDFVGFAEDELTNFSPGDFLFHLNIEQAVKDGVGIYDFGTGDEPYKRSWGTAESRQYDVIAPLSAKGRALAQWLRLRAGIVARIKANPKLWTLAKQMRRRAFGG